MVMYTQLKDILKPYNFDKSRRTYKYLQMLVMLNYAGDGGDLVIGLW